MNKNSKLIRSIGFFVTILVTATITWWLAYNVPVEFIVSQLGALVATAAILVAIFVLIFLVISWPASWSDTARKVFIVGLIVVGILVILLFAGDPIRDLFLAIPMTTILVLLGAVILISVLYAVTISGGLPRKTTKTATVESTTEKTATVTDIPKSTTSASVGS